MLSYFNNAIWIFLEKIIRIVVGFIFLGLISREVGVSNFGVLSFAQTTATMLLCITNLGFDNVLINEFSKNQKNEKVIFSTALISRVVVSIAFVLMSFIVIASYSMPTTLKWVYVISIVSLVFQSQTTWFSFYQAKSKSLVITKLSLLSLIISTVFKSYLLYINSDIFWFSVSYTFDFAIAFIIIFISSQRSLSLFSLYLFRFNVLIDLLKKSWPIIASSVLVVMYTRLDQIMIMKMMGPESVGLYNVAVKIAESYIFVPAALTTSLYPLVSNQLNAKNIRFYFDLVVTSSVLCGIITLVACFWMVPLLFGKAYTDSLNILSITLFSSMFAVIGGAVTNVMIIINLTYMRLVRAVIGLLINFVLNLIMIPQYGVLGAAFASLIAQIFASWFSNVLNSRSHECFKLQTKAILTLGIFGCWEAIKLINEGVRNKINESNKRKN